MLTERRKADRLAMMDRVEALATAYGFKLTRDPSGLDSHVIFGHRGRKISARIECPRGLFLSLDFNGASTQPDVYVCSWYVGIESDARLSPCFARGNVNRFHYSKATTVGYGIDDLIARLTDCFEQIKGDFAFQEGA